jgi:hypothetical protein
VPAVNAGAAQAWFIAGTIVAMVAGGGHGLLALVDTVRPTYFAPIESSVKPVVEGTGIRLRLVERIDAIRPLTIAFSAAYLVLSLRFWFYLPAILTGMATACFTVATVLSV